MSDYKCSICGTTNKEQFYFWNHNMCKSCYSRKIEEEKYKKEHPYICKKCGDDNPKNFFKLYKNICKKCMLGIETDSSISNNKKEKHPLPRRDRDLNKERNEKEIIKYFGNKCISCGYDKFLSSLTLSELNDNLSNKEKYKRVIARNQDSIKTLYKKFPFKTLICHNCLAAFRANEISQDDFLYKEGYVIGPHGIEKKFLIPKEEGIE